MNKKPLSNKTILEHHRFVSVVFNQAEKEMLVQYNPAERATPPRVEQKEANYFEAEDILKISECLPCEFLLFIIYIKPITQKLLVVHNHHFSQWVSLLYQYLCWYIFRTVLIMREFFAVGFDFI